MSKANYGALYEHVCAVRLLYILLGVCAMAVCYNKHVPSMEVIVTC